ncbi:hypothetical protein Tco_0445045 [Tanacetum coccineum]
MLLLFMREANGSFADKVKVKVPFSHKSRRKSIQILELLLDRTMKCIVMLVFTIIIGTKTSGFMAKQNPVFQHRDSNAATISSCVISSSISFADPPQKDAAVQSEVLKLQAMIRGKPMQQDVSNELKNTQQLNSYIVDKSAKIGEGSLLGPCGRFRCQDSPGACISSSIIDSHSTVCQWAGLRT